MSGGFSTSGVVGGRNVVPLSLMLVVVLRKIVLVVRQGILVHPKPLLALLAPVENPVTQLLPQAVEEVPCA